jgi:DTW domain-containing protein YfiP
MPRKIRYEDRCLRCSMRREHCICAETPSFFLETRLVLLMHWRETRSTTNTGRLATLALPNSEVRLRGHRLSPMDDHDLCVPGRTSFLLYPSSDSVSLEPSLLRDLPGPFTLIVPDGNWRQASKVGRREPALAPALRVRLPPGPRSVYCLRRPPQPHCLSTLEAIARAMGTLEGPHVQSALERLMRTMVDRTLKTRSPDSQAAALSAR